MEEDKPGGGGYGVAGGESSSKPMSSFLKSGDRQVFAVELRPGETTYVSWKKLVKDANKANNIGSSKSVPDPQPVLRPNLESRIAPGQAEEDKGKDEPVPNRFSAVIEKIERLYMGKDSSDEELNDTPDDDQYDTEDSFIDDAELDEYFEVDNSAIKHDGFFVNRGKLERVSEPSVIPNQQPKKRQRKDLSKGLGESDDGYVSNKHAKVNKTTAGKNFSAQNLAVTSENYGDAKGQNQLNVSVIPSKKKSADAKMTLDPSSLKISNGSASVSLAEAKDTERQKTGVIPAKNVSSKLKDVSGPSDVSHQKYNDHSAHLQSKSQSGKLLRNVDEPEPSVRQRGKNGNHELSTFNVSEGKYQTTKVSHIHKKDASSARPKSSMLERAIRELEKMVAESRPPAMENQEADTSSQAIKRRLPGEIKLKLAKVARLAASQGKVSKELINRLMSILGHLIQLRTLKRNLKIMISMGLLAKQEKDDRFQQIKKEVVEMIKERVLSLESKAFEHQAGSSDDFQEIGEEHGVRKRKFSMDTALEDKICDLYDLYVDGLDEDAGPQIRKLYVELAHLWPNGLMDNHGIKRAICRAKERRREMYNRHRDREKIKRKKMLTPKTEVGVQIETGVIVQPQYTRERLGSDSGGHGLAASGKPNSNTTAASMRTPSPSASGDRLKQEKLKGSSSNSMDEVKTADGMMTSIKKKVKRKAELDLDGTPVHPEKLPVQQSDERHKSQKLSAGLPQKTNLQSTAPNFEQSS
ncbi:ubinuclein-1-like isoform X2 [Mangifera indica]|uniref:ubinuclein-1-like isoform X2 n=1 Tax=Mangifera indica TaxID=29780 RepID=UPI001CFA684D|nr:ubinuclein-1-like isoform X2 [Mangifera indica]